jgi:hypothetical protein
MVQNSPQDDDHRDTRRQRVLKDGKVVFNNNSSVVDCAIRDMSETGARISCAHQAAVPAECRLLTATDNMVRDARVIWRRGDLLGLRFTSEARRAPPRKW